MRYSCQREAIDYGGERCQSLSGESLEAFVVERLLQVVEPASLEVSLAAVDDIQLERERLHAHWRQRLARAGYEVELARKSYAAVDPEHRLVAKELERRWEEALREQEQLDVEYARFQTATPPQLSDDERLTAEGYQPPKRSPRFSTGILSRFLRDRGIRTGPLPKSVSEENHLLPDEWWLSDLASELSMPIATLHRWQRVGWVTSRKVSATGRWSIFADAEELYRLKKLRTHRRGWPNPYPQDLITPKPNPNRTPANGSC